MTTVFGALRKSMIIGACAATMMTFAAPASAALFDLTYTGTVSAGAFAGNTVSGTLVVDTGINGYPGVVTSLSGSVVIADGSTQAVTLLPVNTFQGNDNTIGTGVAPSSALNNNGLGFSTGGANPVWINIFSLTDGSAYDYWESAPGGGQDVVNFAFPLSVTLTQAPGPVPGSGVAGLAALALAGFYVRTRRA